MRIPSTDSSLERKFDKLKIEVYQKYSFDFKKDNKLKTNFPKHYAEEGKAIINLNRHEDDSYININI